MTSPQGPFGPGAMGVPDLGMLRAQQDAQAAGRMDFPTAAITVLSGMLSELSAIRLAVTPAEIKNHKPCIAPLVDADGNAKGFGVYCLACSDEAQDFIYPCQVQDTTEWPPQVLIPDPDETHAESPPQETSPLVPNDLSELKEE